ncbi:hypothetical protein [Streptomyces misionensis]
MEHGAARPAAVGCSTHPKGRRGPSASRTADGGGSRSVGTTS